MSLSTLSYVFQGQEKLVTLPPHSIWRRKSQQNAIICKNTLLRVDYPSISCHRYFLLKLQAVKSSIRKSSSLIQNPCEMMAESCVISSSTHTHSTSGAWQMHCTQHRAVYTQPCCTHSIRRYFHGKHYHYHYLDAETLPFSSGFGVFFKVP